MTPPTELVVAPLVRERRRVLTDLVSLTKPRTPLCTLVGAVPGALPPVTGWVAAREGLGVGAWVLFGILFLWQLPHTLAIGRLYRDDYARAGVRLLPVIDAQGSSTERQIMTGCLALLAVSLLPTLVGLAGGVY